MTAKRAPKPSEDMGLEEQLILYATELHELYQQEKKEREALAEEKLVLEYKLRELAALNGLFRKHLERREQLENALEGLVQGLREALAKAPPDAQPRLQALVSVAELALSSPPPPLPSKN